MKTKKRLLPFIAMAIFTTQSCDHNLDLDGKFGYPEGTVWAEIPVGIEQESSLTKSTTTIGETIKTVQVVVYNSSNVLVASASGSGSSISMRLPLGVSGHQVYVCANYQQDLSSCSSPDVLKKKISQLSLNSNTAGIEMFGYATSQTFSSGTPVNISVSRLASMVQVQKISAAFTSERYKNKDFTITGIYLTNVVGNACYDGTLPGTVTWFNQMKKVTGSADALITESMSFKLQDSNSTNDMTTAHTFYCYPNPTSTDSRASVFSARKTRLVIETNLDGTTYYYPVDVYTSGSNTLLANTKYVYKSISITGPGVTSPEDQLQKGSISFTISPSPWAGTVESTVEY